MKNIKQGTKEIKVTNRIQGSYSIKNNTLLIYKGYKSNIYYLTYDDEGIMMGRSVASLLKRFDEYINTVDGLDNQIRFIKNLINQPLYNVITEDKETVSIYKVLEASDSLELLETSEINGGRYAIHNKENGAYKFGLCFEAAIYIFDNNKNNKAMKITNIKTNEVILNFKETPENYLIKCDTPKYATHTDEAGNYFCMYGVFAAFDGEEIIKFNNK